MKSKTSAVWIVLLLAACGVAGVMAYVKSTPKLPKNEPIQDSAPQVKPPALAEKPLPQQVQNVTVYLPAMGPDGISFTKLDEPVPEGEDAKVFALNEFLKRSEIAPDDAKVVDVDLREDGLARVDCNKAFEQTYGSFDEKKMLDGFASVLGQFPDVKTYVFEVENEPLKTLGDADLTAPISVIRAGGVPMKPTQSAPPPPDSAASANPK